MPFSNSFQLSESENASECDVVDASDKGVKRLICVRGLLGEQCKSVEILIGIGSSCNVMSKAMCKRLDLILLPCSHVLCGFNGVKSVALGLVTIDCKIEKWHHALNFVVVEHPPKTILGYTRLKQLEMTINCQNDSMQDLEGSQLLCHAVRSWENKPTKPISREDTHPKVHVELMRDVPRQRVLKKLNRLLLPLGKSYIVGPFEIKMANPPFKVLGMGVEALVVVSQVPKLLVTASY